MLNSNVRQGKSPGGWSGFTAGGRQGPSSLPFSPQFPSLYAACVDFRPSPPIPVPAPAFAPAACPFRVSTHKALGQAVWGPHLFPSPSSPVVLVSECPIAGEEVSHSHIPSSRVARMGQPREDRATCGYITGSGVGEGPRGADDGQVSGKLWG